MEYCDDSGNENCVELHQDSKRTCNYSSPGNMVQNSDGSSHVETEEPQALLESKTAGEMEQDSEQNGTSTTFNDEKESEAPAVPIDAPVVDVNSKISYSQATSYWNGVPATVDGMLGGFGHISSTDISGSDSFLKWLFNRKDRPGRVRCVDCGAGIGRITQRLLQNHFGKVDLVEQSPDFTAKAREIFAENPKVGDIFCMGLQDFAPDPGTYDVVWVQWVLIYLPDEALVAYFRRMGQALRPNGVLVVKENFTTEDDAEPAETLLDEEDSSVTRPLDYVIKMATEAGLSLVRSVQQQKFPKKLFKVYMLAFRPVQYSSVRAV